MVSYGQELLENISDLCRVCSSPGSHSIFDKIAPYLHAHPREIPRWGTPICKLVTDVTGLEISKDDGLPQKICVLCISYLKHAHTFRQQAIDNVGSILAAKQVAKIEKLDEESRGNMHSDGERPDTHQKDSYKVALQQVLDGMTKLSAKQNNAVEEKSRRVNAKSRLQAISSEVLPSTVLNGVFSYKEKEFEEDDIMNLDVLKEHNIVVNLPEDLKQKNCPCRKRFMLEDSIKNSSMSSFEFIQRAVFYVRKCSTMIASYAGMEAEITEDVAEEKLSARESEQINQQEAEDSSPLTSVTVDEGESPIPTGSTSTSPLRTIARCEECQISFETCKDLETHNNDYHREQHTFAAALNNLPSSFPQSYIPTFSKRIEIIKNRLLSNSPDFGPDYRGLLQKQCWKCRKRFSSTPQLRTHFGQCRGRFLRQRPQQNGSPFHSNQRNGMNAKFTPRNDSRR
ncbi:uncharacterized protein LOC129768001 isoform X2 [Toxorhynchites rutilus septentrionalis]|uniref:uncharacterized protein LOC129768001 isoform X2 n=1 Tax=Toxorhynchites rutilus septentrionalis TaxID=329112 RepID=UPI002478E3CB|nr:uncharacterized protein LOC129768001 isoform X2 [Toxorhynchites rutilus septentrionalis]